MKEKIFSNETIELFKNNQNKNSSISKIKEMIDHSYNIITTSNMT